MLFEKHVDLTNVFVLYSDSSTCSWIEDLYYTSQRPERVDDRREDSFRLSHVVSANLLVILARKIL